MSNYEREYGTFKLPSAEFASFRQAIQDVDRQRRERAFAITQDFWKGLTRKQQTDTAAYRQALREHQAARYRAQSASSGRWGWHDEKAERARAQEESIHFLADHLLEMKVATRYDRDAAGRLVEVPATGPSRVLTSDMDYPTNRSTQFDDENCTITFDKEAKTVTWSVEENNHAVEHARAGHLGQTFFEHLDKVRWTHGTGGVIAYRSEYDTDDLSVGGGGNSCSGAYGYVGLAEQPWSLRPFINAKGDKVEADITFDRYGQMRGKPKVTKGVARPVGGSRPSAGTTRAKTTAKSTAGSFASVTRGEADGVHL